jgi:amino acid adenylation domain-containing protein
MRESQQGSRLSPQQERLWREMKAAGGRWCAEAFVRIEGDLDLDRLAAALAALVARFEVLRSAIRIAPGFSSPLQFVGAPYLPKLARAAATTDEAAARDLLSLHLANAIDPERGEIFGASIAPCGEGRHLLALRLSALAADAESLGLLVRELAKAYGDPESYGNEETLQHADLAEWLHEASVGDESVDFVWPDSTRHRALRLPGEMRDVVGFDPVRLPVALPRATAEALSHRARELGRSPVDLGLALFAVLIARFSGLAEIPIGWLANGRLFAELDETIGPLARIVPLALRPDPGQALSEFLGEAAETMAAVSRTIPRPAVIAGQEPWMPYLFVVESPLCASGGGARFDLAARGATCERYSVALVCSGDGESLELALDIDAARFDPAERERLAEALRLLASGFVAARDPLLGEVEVVDAFEIERQVSAFNRTAMPRPEVAAHRLFEAVAKREAKSLALVDGEIRWTFGDLEARANRIARVLLRRGVRPEALVALMLPRSADLVAAMLAVWKVGAAYVPIDPSLPCERIAWLLDDSGAGLLVTGARWLKRLGGRQDLAVLALDEAGDEIAAGPDFVSTIDVPADLIAYVLYTSGSTGRPKGVMVHHRGLVNYLLWAVEAYGIAEGTGSPVHSPAGFDLTVTSLFGPLFAGRTVTLVGEGEGVGALAAELKSSLGLSLVKLTPLHLDLLAQVLADDPELEHRCRMLVVGGEALTAETVEFWRRRAPRTRIVNEYGPTETVVGCCVFELPPGGEITGAVPIGRPIANVRLYLLDGAMRSVPDGAPGELFIGGLGVARGYLGRADLTAECFLPDPFAGRGEAGVGARVYRSGDLVRLRRDGNLEFLGRRDHQVKVRGYRVELGEIEAVMAGHPGVREALVVMREDRPGDRQLVGYWRPEPVGSVDDGELMRYLTDRLPPYMLPAAVVRLQVFPLTKNGKVDREELPKPAERQVRTLYEPPSTLIEEALAVLWSDLLGVERVGALDNFFQLGGDSIRTIELVSRARSIGLRINPQSLFRAPVLADLAREVSHELTGEDEAVLAPFALLSKEDRERLPADVEDAFPLARLQAGMLLHGSLRPKDAIYHDLTSFRLRSRFDRFALNAVLQQALARHPALRVSFDLGGCSEPLQRVHKDVAPRLEVEDLRGAPAGEHDLAARWKRELERGFDPAAPSLVRFQAYRLTDDELCFTLSYHHAILDGWSVATLLTEIFGHYAALLAAETWTSESPEVGLREYVALERQALSSPEARAFWLGALADREPAPLRLAPASAEGLPAGRARVSISADQSDALAARARRSSLPLKSLLLAAHLRVLAAATGGLEVATGVVVHGRPERRDGERAVGLFLNTLPLCLRIGDLSWPDLARAALAFERDSYPYRRLPLAEIQRLTGGGELIESVYNYVNFHVYGDSPVVAGLEVVEATFFERTNFPWAANFQREPGGNALGLELHYDAGRIDADQAEAWGDLYRRALEALATRFDDSGTSLLRSGELSQLIATGDGDPPPELPFIGRQFADQVTLRPDALAVCAGEVQVTYGELDRRCGRLAALLRDLGVAAEVPVAVCADRSPDLIVAQLAIWRAGGTYLPLDPIYPAARLARIVEAARPLVFLVDARGEASLPEAASPRLRLDRGAPPARELPWTEPDGAALAYLIFTSGSSGEPKGVAVAHRGLAALADSQADLFGIELESRVLQFASPGFDAAISEVAMVWRRGAVLVVAPAFDLLPGPGLVRLLLEREVTCVTLSPAVLATLPAIDLAVLSTVVAAGEACPLEIAARWAPGRRFLNAYGPTEATVCATCSSPLSGAGEPPIGRPLPGVRALLLDERREPVLGGFPGEIFLGGIGVARGYLRDPAATAERFLPDPFAGVPGARLYATGDRARRLPDGDLAFLGRADRQLKLRGFRIELGEIEAQLRAHPLVGAVAVILREDRGDRRIVAYVAASPEKAAPSSAELRSYLRSRLPEHMVPAVFVALAELPLTPHGKLDRRALPAPLVDRAPAPGIAAPVGALESKIAEIYRGVLGIETFNRTDNFFDLGGHSLSLLQAHARLIEALGDGALTVLDLFEHPSVASLAEMLTVDRSGIAPAGEERRAVVLPGDARIAIVGVAGRFPGAANVEEFWRNLCEGVESISFFDSRELAAEGVDEATRARSEYVPAKGVLEDADLFDSEFFGFSPREAQVLDPQQRLLLECAWEALEGAGYGAVEGRGRVGVFAGESMPSYAFRLFGRPDLVDALGSMAIVTSSDKDFLATRISYELDLEGPSLTVQTACSTSLVAVHLAAQSLRLGECELALAGGVSVRLPQREGYLWNEGGIDSPDGHCRAFDAAAAGTVAGNGVALVVLKRLADAEAAGDRILAVLLGSAINNDGGRKVGYAAPRTEGQARVIRDALALAGVDPATIGYVEGHGTGTPLGDPIEVAALRQAFRGAPPASCLLGSVKSNIGHLDAASGVAGLIKTILAIDRGAIPPSLHVTRPSPRLELAGSPFRIATELTPWPERSSGPRRAGVSSFGIGGTNAHAVLEEAPALRSGTPDGAPQLIVLSARTDSALAASTRRLAEHLQAHPGLDLADVAFTLQVGRESFEHRLAVVAEGSQSLVQALEAGDPERVSKASAPNRKRPIAFLYSGQGAQYPGMGRELYESEPVYRAALDTCCEILGPSLGGELARLLRAGREDADARRDLTDTAKAQPALFATGWALTALWRSWGVEPDALLGHSVGEYLAACVAGSLTLEDALGLVAERGRLMASLPAGAMLSVALPEAEIGHWLGSGVGEGIEIAAVNSPDLVAVAGPVAAIERLAQGLAEAGVEHRRLETSHAFHSALVEPILGRFAERWARVPVAMPRIPWVSNLTGTWVTADEIADPTYWIRQARRPVRFAEGLSALLSDPERILLEVGPGSALATFARRHPGRQPTQTVLSSLPHARDGASAASFARRALAGLWLSGQAIDWRGLHRLPAGAHRRRVALPTYPFERKRHWIDEMPSVPVWGTDRRLSAAESLWVPSWRRSVALPGHARRLAGRPESWLVLSAGGLLAWALGRRLVKLGQRVLLARVGGGLLGPADVDLPAASAEAFGRLLDELAASGASPTRIVVLGPAEPGAGTHFGSGGTSYRWMLALAQAISRTAGEAVEVALVTRGLQQVFGGAVVLPEPAPALALGRVLAQEVERASFRSVDLPLDAEEGEDWAERLVGELSESADGSVVALREQGRWRLEFEHVPLFEPVPSRIRPGGLYWLIGGLGQVGSALAAHLVRSGATRLLLTGRTALPARDRWPEVAASSSDPAAAAVRRCLELEALGAEVLPLAADAADAAAMATALAVAERRFGPLAGVIHAAGLVGPSVVRALEETDEAVTLAIWRAKVGAAEVLLELLRDRDLEIRVFCSSLASVLGGLGFAAYAAANARLDALAEGSDGPPGRRWVSLLWDAWADSARQGGITAAEAGEMFDRALALDSRRVLVSTTALGPRLERWVTRAGEISTPSRAAETSDRPEGAVAFAAPEEALERAVAEVFSEILGVSPVGRHDDFFALGGHSLLATQLISRLRARLGLALPLRSVFEHPTVAGIAAALAADSPGSGRIPVRPAGVEVPLSFAQQGLYFLHRLEPAGGAYNLHAGVRMRGHLSVAVLAASLRAIFDRHEILRTAFVEDSGGVGPVQRVLAAVEVRLSIVDLSTLAGETQAVETGRLATCEAAWPFELDRPPLLRAPLLRLGPQENALLLTLHHIIWDAWSFGIFLRELALLYDALAAGLPARLAPLPIQFADYTVWHRNRLLAGLEESDLAYWRGRLAGAPEELPLHFSRTRTRGTGQGRRLPVELDATVTAALRQLAARTDATLFMVLCAGFAIVLGHQSGVDDLVIGTDVANRPRAETEGLIGYFINQLPLRIDLSGNPTAAALVARLREVTLGAYEHQELPFDRLIAALNPRRVEGRQPLFQVKLVLQNAPMSKPRLADLELELMGDRAGRAQLDLVLNLTESDGLLRGTLEFDTSRFEVAAVAEFSGRLGRVLAALGADADAQIESIGERLAEEDRERLRAEAGQSLRARPRRSELVGVGGER